jgi:hypothetical protein
MTCLCEERVKKEQTEALWGVGEGSGVVLLVAKAVFCKWGNKFRKLFLHAGNTRSVSWSRSDKQWQRISHTFVKSGVKALLFGILETRASIQVITPYLRKCNFVRLRINVPGALLLAENCAFLGYYAASGRNSFPTFRDNLSVPSSGVKIKKNLNSRLLTPDDKTDHSLCHSPRRAQFTSTSCRKP